MDKPFKRKEKRLRKTDKIKNPLRVLDKFNMVDKSQHYSAKNLIYLCNTYGISQTDLASKIGVTKSMISKLVNGRVNFTVDYLVKIADVFEIDLETLVRVDLIEESKKRIKRNPEPLS